MKGVSTRTTYDNKGVTVKLTYPVVPHCNPTQLLIPTTDSSYPSSDSITSVSSRTALYSSAGNMVPRNVDPPRPSSAPLAHFAYRETRERLGNRTALDNSTLLNMLKRAAKVTRPATAFVLQLPFPTFPFRRFYLRQPASNDKPNSTRPGGGSS